MNETRKEIVNYIEANFQKLVAKRATIGIDGFVDKIQKVVQSKSSDNEYVFFSHIAKFGSHLISKSGQSCGIEVCQKLTKLGGCSPNMASALGNLSVKVNCIGTLGYPQIDPLFKELHSNCTLYTIGNPGYTTALEFDDGKVMLIQKDFLHDLDWKVMKNILTLDKLKEFFFNSNLIGLVDWNNIVQYNDILEGILREVLPEHTQNKKQIIFFDLADFSERSKEDICKAIQLINKFNLHYKAILSLNESEAISLYNALYPEIQIADLKALGQAIYDAIGIDSVVIHTLIHSFAWDENGISETPSLYVQKPKLSTGGGDNFNAGLCLGQLLGLDLEGSLYVANAVSGYYVRNGHSPSIENLIDTLGNWESLIEIP